MESQEHGAARAEGSDSRPLSVVVAGGGTAGHIEPALAVADAVRRLDPQARITALGTSRGLETSLVPERGYELSLIPPVPLPRKPGVELAKTPLRLARSVAAARKALAAVDADVVVGFGGYVSIPAYLAAQAHLRGKRRLPVVIHEANASAGIANKVGARFADVVLAAVDGSGLADARVVGIPVRGQIAELDRAALRAKARHYFGLDEDAPTLLVFGGSQGAAQINAAVAGAAEALGRAGIGVLHAYGPKNSIDPVSPEGAPPYRGVGYLKRMDLAYAAADLVVCRSGAMTVAEVSATGLPAIYVPLPHGNGEQRLNALPVVRAGGGLLVDNDDLTSDWVAREVPALLSDPERLAAMSAAASGTGHRDAATEVARAALDLAARFRAGEHRKPLSAAFRSPLSAPEQ
ncbi:UDP-N-acetylglucosamine--N-acetylmuramyl-(pentapeptide) pyrophosphoryl-undecaprenol N-acetylglucosamine transferase MurG [Gordonia polyisoprenivorans VH2]|uniref:UDP-N-acetylglucosamine--N-acetylmuramyl-(pentapeptide) pyrophosphoryl-undecaprenol N-acetylglucosamine transferase n=1 Tax=Gordonia polyisoprenivorans (strain DSM 44266 / VH2) TaxID=1112204 RepID=H6MSM7_GORPV|nr:undecaprenyldiphospho-muramoylpentapeptide beta-N-acetylglucosaminyltransferase [Gordonia polyisoprenivorans]AFA73795.1 UDP-N-acetylglucosamine--N-acetylmuramyl-(pentapeptide) pyrophosphoryl-undecaprenol N-acetylglucosamine transferase MurG [Gordonia polyisoprenivorans VH2]